MVLRVAALAFLILLPASPSARAADEGKGLEGSWVVSHALDGSLFDGPLNGALFIFKGKRLVVVTADNEASGGPCTAAEGGKAGRHLDFTFKGVKVKGRYRQDGKGVTLCFDRAGKERPDGFHAGTDRPDVVLLRLERKSGEGDRDRAWARKAAEGFLTQLARYPKSDAADIKAFCAKDVTASKAESWATLDLPGSTRRLVFGEAMPEVALLKETSSPSGDEVVFEGTFSGLLHSASFEFHVKREDGTRWRVASFLPAYRGIGLSAAPSLGKDLDAKVIADLRDKLAKMESGSEEKVAIVALALGSHGEAASDSLPALAKLLGNIVRTAETEKHNEGYAYQFDNLTALTVAIGNIGPPAAKHVPDLLKVAAVHGAMIYEPARRGSIDRKCSQHREALAVALGKIGGDEALRALKAMADTDAQLNVRRAAAASLKRLLAAKKEK
jgi:hypothetical protein